MDAALHISKNGLPRLTPGTHGHKAITGRDSPVLGSA